MNPVVEEWVQIAKADFGTAKRELEVTDCPHYGAVCYHAQQSAEKIMKAVLINRGIQPPKIHDLSFLSELIAKECPGWFWPEEELRFLTRAAVDYRYPGEMPDYDEAVTAVEIGTQLLLEAGKLIPNDAEETGSG